MKNLSLWQVTSKKQFDFLGNKTICYGRQEESDTGEFFMCLDDLSISNVNSDGETVWRKDLVPLISSKNTPINMTYLGLIKTVCIAFEKGEIVTSSRCGEAIDMVGYSEKGLLALEWSPDQESLVLVTADYSVLLMSCTFDPLVEQNLLTKEFGEKEFVTVGWGKKETQFHGSEGKHARTKTEIVAEDNIEDVNKVIISWRGDGNFFAVGFTMEGIRRFKVFDKGGNLLYTSEKTPGLEANLAWRPSGNLIATTQKVTDKHVVSFFEKNGLQHGGFDIPINSNTIVSELLWSSDSEILAIVCKDISESETKILLFTTSNYHWYLKQTLVFQQNINKVLWDNDFDIINNKRLHVYLENGQYYSYTWVWSIDHSNGRCEKDDAIVAVIDDKKVLISTFRYTIMPPPLFNVEIDLDFDVVSLAFAPESASNPNLLVIVTLKNLVFLEQTGRNPLNYSISKKIAFEENKFPFQHYKWHWLDDDRFICTKVGDDMYEIVQFKVDEKSLTVESIYPVHSAVTGIKNHPVLPSIAFLQLDSGEILKYSEMGMMPLEITVPDPCKEFSVLSIQDEVYFVGLSHKGGFFVMDKLVINNVSSYFIHSSFLLVTTLKHNLVCTELSEIGLERLGQYSKIEPSGLYERKIERGAKLLVAIPKDTKIVFQLPRGNLEVIQPRPLSLKIIGEYLDTQKYYEAFVIMRKQRINLNLIYDHDPDLFIKNINVFLKSIDNNSWLNLFLTDLENTDVTQTMYASSYFNKKSKVSNVDNKVYFICEEIRRHIKASSNCADRILPLLTTYVKKNTIKDLEKALFTIKELKMKESTRTKLPVSSDEALKYLLYMVNVDHLFDVALGMYDFELVLLVATKSQKDPKEYEAMLNELNEMEENYRKYTINKHLKRFDKAVQCLAQCGESKHEELRTFVKYHSLYREALALFSKEDEIYKQVSDDFGHYLKLKKQYIEAGIVYEMAKIYNKAVLCYIDGLEWELALKLSQNVSVNEFTEICWELAKTLKEEKRHCDAIRILEQFLNDKNSITFAIECGKYKTALRLCTKYGEEELIESKVIPAVLEEYGNTQELLETSLTNFLKYKDRLLIVRQIKSTKPEDSYEGYGGNKDSDLYSDAGSTIASSTGSGRSYRSGKNRRKHERKVESLKEGSQYEDIALSLALHRLVTSAYEMRKPVKELNISLCCLNMAEKALELQTNLEKLLKVMKDSFKQIWNNEFTLQAVNAAIAVEKIQEGGDLTTQGLASLEPHFWIAPVVHDVDWKLEGLNC